MSKDIANVELSSVSDSVSELSAEGRFNEVEFRVGNSTRGRPWEFGVARRPESAEFPGLLVLTFEPGPGNPDVRNLKNKAPQSDRRVLCVGGSPIGQLS